MDWSLVLLSQGIETIIDSDEIVGWGLIVSEVDYNRALSAIRQYQIENQHWPWRQKISPKGILFDWGSVSWVLLIGLFFWIQTHASSDFRDAGLMDAASVSHGEWWRIFTAIFLHADLGHFAMNASLGLALLGLTMGSFGTGVGLLAAYLAGAGGNLTTWLVFAEHRSLGASGMVMGCVGLLAAQAISYRRGASQKLKYAFGGLIVGAMLFTLFGTSPNSDVLAHLGGFVSGILIGALLLIRPNATRTTKANILAGTIFCVLAVLPWWLALSKVAAH